MDSLESMTEGSIDAEIWGRNVDLPRPRIIMNFVFQERKLRLQRNAARLWELAEE